MIAKLFDLWKKKVVYSGWAPVRVLKESREKIPASKKEIQTLREWKSVLVTLLNRHSSAEENILPLLRINLEAMNIHMHEPFEEWSKPETQNSCCT
jgi:hypothetical protein